MPENMLEEMSERYVRKNVKRYVRRYVRRNVKKICQKECQKICQKEGQKICQKECQKMCQKECQKICPKECREISQKIQQKECQKICQKECQKICQKECQKICQKKCQKDMSEIMSKDRSERMSEDMSERRSERYVRRYVIRKSVKRFVRKNVTRYVRKMSERMSEDMSERMSEDMSGRMSENMSQIYVHTHIWITRIHVCTNRILWMASCFLFYLAHCSKYCWLNFVFVQGSEFGLAAMAEVVVERRETIFIGTANQVAKGVEHVWRYKLTFVGAERVYVCMEPPSTTHAGDLMFIMEEVVEGNTWYVAYEGRPVPNAEGEQELEKRAAVFRTSASFWENGVHEWETNDVRSRATYTEEVKEPQWQASGFMVCTRHEM